MSQSLYPDPTQGTQEGGYQSSYPSYQPHYQASYPSGQQYPNQQSNQGNQRPKYANESPAPQMHPSNYQYPPPAFNGQQPSLHPHYQPRYHTNNGTDDLLVSVIVLTIGLFVFHPILLINLKFIKSNDYIARLISYISLFIVIFDVATFFLVICFYLGFFLVFRIAFSVH